ncbi:hypothetical protein [Dinoroseobacter sp. S76]|uniref:hypothetical protein n=1 Tax=Dinoroseobacter sp. S76 TaxID=3415124 RepID=UPI003C7D46A7
MFWGNSDSKRASGSLRSAAFQLRRDFQKAGDDVIQSHRNHISLAPDRWRVERSSDAELFLEGMDLDVEGAESFEDWLREQRVSEEPEEPPEEPLIVARAAPSPGFRSNIMEQNALGILPTEIRALDPRAETYANLAVESLLQNLSILSPVAIFDLRGVTLEGGGLPSSSTTSRTLLLKSVVYQQDKEFFIWLELVAPRSGRKVKSFQPVLLGDVSMETGMLSAAEKILDEFVASLKPDLSAELAPWAVLSSLFSLDADAVTSTEAEVDRLLLQGGSPSLRCVKVFIQIFKENEGVADARAYEPGDLILELSRVPLNDPLRPLCESLIGYSAHMLCSDNQLGTMLLEKAKLRAPNLAINLDHLAVLHLSQGNLSAAKDAYTRCTKLSAQSSWRYSYDITGAMIAMASGDFRSALRLANSSLIKKPRFVGALRYAMIGFAMTESAENARLMKQGIFKLRPSYNLEGWVEGLLKRSDPVFANNVSITLHKHSLI